jgi:hypothetical protein
VTRIKQDLSREVFAQEQKLTEARKGLDTRVLEQRRRLRKKLFRQQLELVEDSGRFKAVLCSRRAGKSYAGGTALVDKCLEVPGANCIFITMTRGKAKRLLWSWLHRIGAELSLGLTFNNTELTATFPNGSMITLAGAETAADIEKFRGEAFDLAVIDECKSFPTSLLDELVDDVIGPALGDNLGSLILMGTPGAMLQGTFFLATGPEATTVVEKKGKRLAISRRWDDRNDERYKDVEFSWSFHSWSTKDNVKKPHLWAEALAQKLRAGWQDEDPTWRREWLGQWVDDDSAFVLRYSSEKNSWTPNPEWSDTHGLDPAHEWHYVLGLDLGYDDDFDIEVFAWSDTSPLMFHVAGFNAPGMEVQDMALKLREFVDRFSGFDVMVGDRGGLGKVILATLDSQYGLYVEPADKNEKRDFIELMNSDLVNQKLYFLKGSNLELQATTVQWDETKKHVDDNTPDHAIDASLYIWRYCYHHYSRNRHVMPDKGSADYYRKQQIEEMQTFEKRHRRAQKMDFTDLHTEDTQLDQFSPVRFGDMDWNN